MPLRGLASAPPPVVASSEPSSLIDLVAGTSDLPAMPTVALAAHRETNKDAATTSSVAALVATDPALATRVLRLANSSFYGGTKRVSSIPEAVLMLGMRGVRNVCLLAGTYPWLQKGLPAYGIAPGALWAHSLATAVAASYLAGRLKMDADVAFTAGLLHDLGKVPIGVRAKPGGRPLTSLDDERASVGFDHCQTGGHMALLWNLPSDLAYTISGHHEPQQGLDHVVHIADFVAHLATDKALPKLDRSSLEHCAITLEELPGLTEYVLVEFEKHRQTIEGMK